MSGSRDKSTRHKQPNIIHYQRTFIGWNMSVFPNQNKSLNLHKMKSFSCLIGLRPFPTCTLLDDMSCKFSFQVPSSFTHSRVADFQAPRDSTVLTKTRLLALVFTILSLSSWSTLSSTTAENPPDFIYFPTLASPQLSVLAILSHSPALPSFSMDMKKNKNNNRFSETE